MTNRLGREASPYLQQHKDNPIAWYAWGDDAFAEARARDVPIFLSVGYSTCHWCHVMAHESFEDAEVAEVLNRGFVSIKVDREERPDIDNVYMKALQALSGGGGWPMSVWLTPAGQPFFAGTYFPKYRFLQILRRIGDVWQNQRASLASDGERLTAALAEREDARGEREDADGGREDRGTGDDRAPAEFGLALDSADGSADTAAVEAERREFLAAYTTLFQHVFDEEHGGFGAAPKFPQTMNLQLMMRQDRRTGLRQAEVMVLSTLHAMLRFGLYDHLRGGFHRYAVDRAWGVPHFEKMLYDQAMISETLLDALLVYGPDAELRLGLGQTLDYVLREMTAADGGFFAAQDADSLDPAKGHKEEGYFATFTPAELRAALAPAEFTALDRVYRLREGANFEGRLILHRRPDADLDDLQTPEVRSGLRRLETIRQARPAPHRDDKIIAGWNGWMIRACARAGRVFAEPRWSEAAARALGFIKQNLWIDDRLHRYYGAGRASEAVGCAEDYAAVIAAALELSQGAEAAEWADFARALQVRLDADFWDQESDGYFTGDGRDPHLPVRTKDEFDGVTPGANSLAALNLVQLYHLTGEAFYQTRAEAIFRRGFATLKHYPSGLPFFGLAMDVALSGSHTLVFAGEGWPETLRTKTAAEAHPYIMVFSADDGWPVCAGKTGPALYACAAGRCELPARDPAAAAAQIARR